ncbi:MAG: hypothetical protein MUC29_02180 [Pyrinomonadaceae bacterium]|nr:hypothetical protein [Pyrinomonadaceae bacterium]
MKNETKDFILLIITAFAFITTIFLNQFVPFYIEIPIIATIWFFIPFPLDENSKPMKDIFLTNIDSVYVRWLVYVSLLGIIRLLMSTIKNFIPDNWLGSVLNLVLTILMIIVAFMIIEYFTKFFKSR